MFSLVDIADALLPRACAGCEGPTSAVFCARCLESVQAAPPSFLACALFGGAVADAIRRAKFGPDEATARALGRFWVDCLEQGRCAPLPVVDGIAFVPAPYRRRLMRGFDLPALLASSLARWARVPVVDALDCTRADAPLSHGADKAARSASVAGRYRARAHVRGRALLLVDDVHTTGATLGEASRVLREGGAAVVPASFAVAP